ncbi:PadR family transcriptional regulator [Candidatus Micrarchaeota archaeon]|nr:PadR family transcriptional regulator [Candidatus Micrarchaeota archaeon]
MASFGKLEKQIPPSIKPLFKGFCSGREKSPEKMLHKMAMTFVLWIMNREPMTGYELMKLLKSDHHGPSATPSRIYPLLSAMEEDGLLRSKILKKGKRESKQYSITAKGKLVLKVTNRILSKMRWGEFLRDISRK